MPKEQVTAAQPHNVERLREEINAKNFIKSKIVQIQKLGLQPENQITALQTMINDSELSEQEQKTFQTDEAHKIINKAREFIKKLEPGAMVTVEWRRQPIFIVRRTKESLQLLKQIPQKVLKDPESQNLNQQPEYATNEVRSSNPEYLVIKGVCTHLGCAPKFRPELAAADLGSDWVGGFFCPCHGSKFDLAGRVYAGAPAGANLPVPPHRFDGDVVVVGEDPEVAS